MEGLRTCINTHEIQWLLAYAISYKWKIEDYSMFLHWKQRCCDGTVLFKVHWTKDFHFRGGRGRHGRGTIHWNMWVQLFEEFPTAESVSVLVCHLQSCDSCKTFLTSSHNKWVVPRKGNELRFWKTYLLAATCIFFFSPLPKLEIDSENFPAWGQSQLHVSLRPNPRKCWVTELVEARKCSGFDANWSRQELTRACSRRAQFECADAQQNEMEGCSLELTALTGNPIKPNEDRGDNWKENAQKAALETLGSATQKIIFQIQRRDSLEAPKEDLFGTNKFKEK